MSNIVQYKIDACKFDYEYLGRSVKDLAQSYGFLEANLLTEIEQSGWERKIQPTELPDTADMEKFAKELETATRSKLTIIGLFRQIEQQPLISQIEKALLNKILLLASSVKIDDPRATTQINNLVKAIQMIQDRNPISLADTLKDSLNKPGTVVQIANYIK